MDCGAAAAPCLGWGMLSWLLLLQESLLLLMLVLLTRELYQRLLLQQRGTAVRWRMVQL